MGKGREEEGNRIERMKDRERRKTCSNPEQYYVKCLIIVLVMQSWYNLHKNPCHTFALILFFAPALIS